MERIGARVRRVASTISPRAILVAAWLVFMVYAYPGYMSFDPVYQLAEARRGVFSDWHPPVMAEIWRLVDMIIAGPLGMLLLQSVCFLAGLYMVLARWMSKRAAAIVAGLVLWFPVVSSTMAVIWKDSLMSAFLMLGTALILSTRRRVRLLGAAALVIATGARYNALAMTLPLVVLLFVWNPDFRWWKRYPISIAMWLAITLSARVLSTALTDVNWYLWHQSLARLDIVGTLGHLPHIPDGELAKLLVGNQVIPKDHLHDKLRINAAPEQNKVEMLWSATDSFSLRPTTKADRDAIVASWKAIVPTHPIAYLTYRLDVFRQLVQLTDVPLGSPIYVWFTDVQDLGGSASKIDHDASPGVIQNWMREQMLWLGDTPLFHIYLYLFLALGLLPFCFRDREIFAILASGLVGEAALFFLTPTTDFRYSFWLVFSTILATILLIAKRAGARPDAHTL